jgi:hypothetical protein
VNAGAACRREKDCGGTNKVTDLCQRTPPHRPRTRIQVENQFGTIRVDTVKPDRLLVPSTKSLTEPLDPPDPAGHRVEHFKCYSIKPSQGEPPFTPILGVAVTDQLQQPKLYDVVKPTRLCNPVDKEREGVENVDEHLICYQVKLTTTRPAQVKHVPVTGIFVGNQLGRERIDTRKDEELCVPSAAS